MTERYVMQASINSPNNVIIHNHSSLSRTPDMDKRVEIFYYRGDIGFVSEPEVLKEKSLSKSHNLGKTLINMNGNGNGDVNEGGRKIIST